MPDMLTPERIEEIRERLKKRGLRHFYTHVYADAQVVDAIDDLAALLAHITAQQERIERLERVLDLACAASVKDCGTCEEWCREGPGLKSGCVVAYRAEAALRGAE